MVAQKSYLVDVVKVKPSTNFYHLTEAQFEASSLSIVPGGHHVKLLSKI